MVGEDFKKIVSDSGSANRLCKLPDHIVPEIGNHDLYYLRIKKLSGIVAVAAFYIPKSLIGPPRQITGHLLGDRETYKLGVEIINLFLHLVPPARVESDD